MIRERERETGNETDFRLGKALWPVRASRGRSLYRVYIIPLSKSHFYLHFPVVNFEQEVPVTS